MSRPTIYEILKRGVEEGVRGLPDKSHANTSRPGVDLPTRNLIRKKQEENPLRGRVENVCCPQTARHFCITTDAVRRIMAENRRLYAIKPPSKEPHQPKPHPFKATERHERWCLDIRYIEKHRIRCRSKARFMSSRSWMPSRGLFSPAIFSKARISPVS